MEEVHSNNEWIVAGGCSHLQALLKELHTGTWASTEGLAGVLQFQSGTLAGTPIADLVFIVAFARVLRKVRMNLKEVGLFYPITTDGAAQYFEDATLDDHAGEMKKH